MKKGIHQVTKKEKHEHDEGTLPKGVKSKPLSFDGQKISKAHKIMSEIAKASMKKVTPMQNGDPEKQQSKSMSGKDRASSKSQSKSAKASQGQPTGRAKSQVQQKVPKSKI